MIELGLLFVIGAALLAGLLALATLVKAVLWVVFLPIRLVFWLLGTLLLLPILLFKFLFGGLIFLIALPIILITAIAAFAAFAVAVLLPALPVILLVAVIWYLVRPQPQTLVRT